MLTGGFILEVHRDVYQRETGVRRSLRRIAEKTSMPNSELIVSWQRV